MGRRVGLPDEGLGDEAAVTWLREAETILFSTTCFRDEAGRWTASSPQGRAMYACRREVKKLRNQGEAAGTAPAKIMVEVRALIEERGFSPMVEAFVHRSAVRRHG